jgi:hypothetical protein
MTYASEEMFLEVELDVRVLLDYLEDLDCLIDDLMRHVSAFPSCFAGSYYLGSYTVTCTNRVSSCARSWSVITYRGERQY